MKQQLRKQQFKSLLLAVLTFMPLATSAQIEINETNFPDASFRLYLLNQSYGKDGILTEDEIREITELHPFGSSNLKGIEYFTALEKLICGTGVTSLDVSKNTALTYLDCSDTKLTTLDVSKNTALKELRCDNSELTSLDVSKNTALTYLSCSFNNKLTSLNVSNTALEELFCYDNNLTSLDVSGLTTLTRVDCYGNSQLTSLNASGCTALTRAGDSYGGGLNWRNTSLNTLDISNCTSLERLNIEDCPLMTLNASGCTVLERINAEEDNQLTTIDVSNCIALSSLDRLYENSPKLTTLNASGCTALEDIRFDLQERVLETLNVSNCTALTRLYCLQNKLTSLNVANCTALTNLRCYENQLKGEGMDAFINSLPENTTGEKYTLRIFCVGSDKEGNVCTTDHVAIAKAKGWSVENNWGVEYEGIATAITLPTIENIDENAPIYDLSGKRVNNLQGKKGIYIVGDKKVVVK